EESLLVGVFAADPETSYGYAGAAAAAARLLGWDEYLESAIRAWDWAEANETEQLAALQKRRPDRVKKATRDTTAAKGRAAIELFRATGDPKYHDAINREMLADLPNASAYAMVTESEANADLREAALELIRKKADEAVSFSSKNGFNLAMADHLYLPMMGYASIWSVPGSGNPNPLVRAHYHLGEERFLAALIGSALYSAGANPMNRIYTTGLGPLERQPSRPLHLDYRRSGQAVPEGISVYGQSDPAMNYGFDAFAHQWYLNRFGGVDSKQWPTAEAYIDLGMWPAMNEYTVAQNLGPTAFVWGYLAARGR
ncbi:MAG: hypothetical protein AAF236_10225, partial [Verrucomicrobiota bacterium]